MLCGNVFLFQTKCIQFYSLQPVVSSTVSTTKPNPFSAAENPNVNTAFASFVRVYIPNTLLTSGISPNSWTVCDLDVSIVRTGGHKSCVQKPARKPILSKFYLSRTVLNIPLGKVG